MSCSHDIRAEGRTDERGFTLVELIIGMILTGILLALVSSFLLGGFGSTSKSATERKAIESANHAMTQFSDDLRQAKSPDRGETTLSDKYSLQAALLEARPTQGRVNGTTLQLDVRDLVEATPTSVMFRADALPVAGVECVRYFAQSDPNYPDVLRLIRRVHPYIQGNATTRGRCDTGRTLLEQVVMERVR